jgi:hypothetical protein
MAFQLIDNYGDYSMINGTLNPQATLPKQWVLFQNFECRSTTGLNMVLVIIELLCHRQ